MRNLLIVLCLIGCGQVKAIDRKISSSDNPNGTKVVEDATLATFMRKFDGWYGVSSKHISSEFATLESPTVGLCWTYNDGSHLIQIDSTYWNNSSDECKEQVILHEYGHCEFGLDHNDKWLILNNYGTIPESVMNPYVFCGQEYTDFHDYYVKELKP